MARRLLGLTLAAMFAAPASALAYKDVAYSVRYEGEGSYKSMKYDDSAGADYAWEEEIGVSFEFVGEINEGVVFRDGHPFDTSGDGLGTSFAAGGITYRGRGVTPQSCLGQSDHPAHGWTRLMEDDELLTLDGETRMWIRPFEEFSLLTDCADGETHPDIGLTDLTYTGKDGLALPGKHTFDAPFSVPTDVFGMGYIEQLIPKTVVEGARCPNFDERLTTTCRLEWSGKVILRKLWEKEVKPTGKPQPPSTPPGKPAPLHEDDWLVPLVTKGSARLSPDRSTASAVVSCRGGCAGTASVVRAGQALRSARFKVAAGKSKRVSVGIRNLRRPASGGLKLRLRFARPTRSTQTYVLKIPRRR